MVSTALVAALLMAGMNLNSNVEVYQTANPSLAPNIICPYLETSNGWAFYGAGYTYHGKGSQKKFESITVAMKSGQTPGYAICIGDSGDGHYLLTSFSFKSDFSINPDNCSVKASDYKTIQRELQSPKFGDWSVIETKMSDEQFSRVKFLNYILTLKELQFFESLPDSDVAKYANQLCSILETRN